MAKAAEDRYQEIVTRSSSDLRSRKKTTKAKLETPAPQPSRLQHLWSTDTRRKHRLADGLFRTRDRWEEKEEEEAEAGGQSTFTLLGHKPNWRSCLGPLTLLEGPPLRLHTARLHCCCKGGRGAKQKIRYNSPAAFSSVLSHSFWIPHSLALSLCLSLSPSFSLQFPWASSFPLSLPPSLLCLWIYY